MYVTTPAGEIIVCEKGSGRLVRVLRDEIEAATGELEPHIFVASYHFHLLSFISFFLVSCAITLSLYIWLYLPSDAILPARRCLDVDPCDRFLVAGWDNGCVDVCEG